MGAWIEIRLLLFIAMFNFVAPYMGAWIEICETIGYIYTKKSLPTWERGLKSQYYNAEDDVYGRSLHGSVD